MMMFHVIKTFVEKKARKVFFKIIVQFAFEVN